MQSSALCRSRRELSNAHFLAKIGFDTAENEPSKVCALSENIQKCTDTSSSWPGHREKNTRPARLPGRDRDVGCRSARASGVGRDRRHDGRSAKFRQNVARFRLYRHRSLQVNTRFSAFFKIYQINQLKILKISKISQILRPFAKILLNFHENC